MRANSKWNSANANYVNGTVHLQRGRKKEEVRLSISLSKRYLCWIVGRLVSSPARQNEAGGSGGGGGGATQHAATFAVRVGTMDGVVTHHLRAETRRDLAAWARAIVQGCHAAAHSLREYTVREYIFFNKILSKNSVENLPSKTLNEAFSVKELFYRKILNADFSVNIWKEDYILSSDSGLKRKGKNSKSKLVGNEGTREM